MPPPDRDRVDARTVARDRLKDAAPSRMRAFDLITPPITACATIAVGLLLSAPHSRWLEGALIVAIAVTASTLTALLISQYFARRFETATASRLADVISAATLRSDSSGEFWTQDQLSTLERVIDVETIWIVGRDFGSEITSEAPFLDVVRYNIHERGIRYVYIAPDSPLPRHQLGVLATAVGVTHDDRRLCSILLPDRDWQRLPYTDGNFTIYDPLSSRSSPTGYFWYPGADGSSFGRLSVDVVLRWVAEVEDICPSVKEAALRG